LNQQVKHFLFNGDVLGAIQYLNELPDDHPEVVRWKGRLMERFITCKEDEPSKLEDPFINSVLSIYQTYFRLVLMKKLDVKKGEKWLFQHLSELVPACSNIDEVEKELQSIFEDKGWNFLGGVTAPFRGPFIWKTNEKKSYIVELPLGTQNVDVIFMSNFIMQSWLHYATFGEHYAGGWAKEDALYCVKEAYEPLDDEVFNVSFLKHEAQHFYDYEHYPNLPGYVLEYRAKLVELMEDRGRVWGNILAEAKNDQQFPHSYAAYLIRENIKTMYNLSGDQTEWQQLKMEDIQRAAKILLDRSTDDLNNQREIGLL
jgi:hypothetical protein